MLDSDEYRLSESASKAQVHSWRIPQTHLVDHFEKVGFPVRPKHFFEIAQLLDTMQENRFELFMEELGGLCANDSERLKSALVQCVDFQLIHFPRRDPIVPLSTMLSSLALYKKLMSSMEGEVKILEVGPGCGYLTFFAAQDPRIVEYTQVEAAESFYILQNRISNYCYGSHFLDFAHQFDKADFSYNIRDDLETGGTIAASDVRRVRGTHFPWWMLGLLASRHEYYEIVSSNANLNEFSRPALADYLSIFNKVLKPEGLFIVQCTGFTAHGSLEGLYDELHRCGFAPLISTIAGDVPKNSLVDTLVMRGVEKYFTLNNLVLVKAGHPLFEGCNDRARFENGMAAELETLGKMYEKTADGVKYTKEQFLTAVVRDMTENA